MNAIIALCNFCEAHGPCLLFCTQTLRDTSLDELSFSSDVTNKECPACNSLGIARCMVSEDAESNANFVSCQVPVLADLIPTLKQASVRSLSCEVSGSKDGGIVFFGDASRGHVLSHTFSLRDSQARGFSKLFSIVILMKDKMFLLNMQPFLSAAIQELSKEMQDFAQAVYTGEQSLCSERAQRLKTGQVSSGQVSRSLVDLTGVPEIFAIVHSHFTWILLAGARHLVETNNWTCGPTNRLATVNVDRDDWFKKLVDKSNVFWDGDHVDEEHPISVVRQCRDKLRSDFVNACFCVLCGIQIVIRGSARNTYPFLKCFHQLLPKELEHLIRMESGQYEAAPGTRVLATPPEIPVPNPCASIYRIEVEDFDADLLFVKWSGDLPSKQPDLVVKIMKAIDEKLFTDLVLDKHIRVLIEEWKNKILCMKRITSNQDLNKLKKILGVQSHDLPLVNYWTNNMRS